MAKFDGLTDLLPRRDHTARHLAYNNTLDRNRIELPPSGDLAASGVVGINLDSWPNGLPTEIHSASGTPDIPVYLQSDLDFNNDSVTAYNLSASGTSPIPVYLDSPIPVEVAVDIETDSIRIYSASGTHDIPVYLQSDLDHNNDSVEAYNVSASGTPDIPTYVQNEVDVRAQDFDIRPLDEAEDDVRIYSASGTAALESWINNEPIQTEKADPEDSKLVKKRFTYNANNDIETIKEALIGAPSGAPCKLSTFTYNANDDIAYIDESVSTW